MFASRVLAGFGVLLVALGAVPWMMSHRTAVYDAPGLMPLSAGAALLVMAWIGTGRRRSRGEGQVTLWIGVALMVLTVVLWNVDNRSVEHKLGLFAVPWVPGVSLVVMGWTTLVAHRPAAEAGPGARGG